MQSWRRLEREAEGRSTVM
ncbi:hypothetical protein EYZ11_013489 [Aspergillus tanneri]|uniref:Uncharacterized protein n=1 Tax=Aspergillus tanneri TaxID=1220188 RepID=A0A4S3IXS8_9EURO|nr:hypothetical protein EYZ11_013489 [Aspergillus tanneri]